MDERMKQRTTEWVQKFNSEYHERQFKEVYRSTIAFCGWLETIGHIQEDSQLRILDCCSGQGANTYYMGRRYPNCTFVGVDINAEVVTKGNGFFEANGVTNCQLEVGDIYNLGKKYLSRFDGIVCYQTLSWLPEFKKPIEAIIELDPKWIALTSLFYDGHVSCAIEITEYDADLAPSVDAFYNVYSLPLVRKSFSDLGYSDFQSTQFEIDIDLPKPDKKIMTTYTEKTEHGHRLQLSGPLLMP